MKEGLGRWLWAELSPDLAARFSAWQIFERALLGIGIGAWLALVLRAGLDSLVVWELGLACALYAVVVHCLRGSRLEVWQRLRLFAAYGFTLWFYAAVERITPALGTELWDARLRAFDRWIFSETPAALMSGSWWKTELFSGAYTSYLIYLHFALLGWLIGPLGEARRFWTYLFVTYPLGFLGYLLVPAIGPAKAFPEIFSGPVVASGEGILSALNNQVAQGSSVYDVFPSLHILITLVLLDFDWRYRPMRFYWMLPVAGLLFLSTVYLRYHYLADLLAGALLFLALRVGFDRWLVWDSLAETLGEG